MNKCAEYAEMISAYIDDELPESDRHLIELHLAECASCAAARDAYLDISSAVQESLAAPPESLRGGIMSKIKTENARAKRQAVVRMILTRYLPLAACLALFLLTLPQILNRNDKNELSKQAGDLVYHNENTTMPSAAKPAQDGAGQSDEIQTETERQFNLFATTDEMESPPSNQNAAPASEPTQEAARQTSPKPEPDNSAGREDGSVSFAEYGDTSSDATSATPAPSGAGATSGGGSRPAENEADKPETSSDDAGKSTEPTPTETVSNNASSSTPPSTANVADAPRENPQSESPDMMPPAIFPQDADQKTYFAVIKIKNPPPDFLYGYERIITDSGIHIIIPRDAAIALIKSGIPDTEVEYADDAAPTALVIVLNYE